MPGRDRAGGRSIINSYAGPTLASYLDLLRDVLVDRGLADKALMMARVATCLHADAGVAHDSSRLMVEKLFWSSYPDRGFVGRAGVAVPAALEDVIASRDYVRIVSAARLVPDGLIDASCWAGTPGIVAEGVVEVARAAGIEELSFWVLRASGQSIFKAVRLLTQEAEEVPPRVRWAPAVEGVAGRCI